MFILLTVCHTFHTFLLEFNRFLELSRTSSPFPGLSSPGKCHNKIPGLSRFSRTRTNPVYSKWCDILKILLSDNHRQKSWDMKQVLPSPTYVDNQEIFFLFVEKNATFSNTD